MEFVKTDDAPAAVGPYSQAIVAGGFLFTAGQIGLDPKTGSMVDGGVQAQARRALANLRAILEAGGSGMDRVVRASVFVQDIADFKAVNEVYAEAFGEHRPARTLAQAAALPLGALVEIDAVAQVS